jgi:selenide,water dikinase
MVTLNRGAAEAMLRAGVDAATDVTGFGLLGHLREILLASGLSATVHAGSVPLLPRALELAIAGHIPGGTRRNLEDVAGSVRWADDVPEALRVLLCDAQTSGGLLMAVPPDRVDALSKDLAARGTPAAALVGELREGEPGTLEVVA